MVKEAPTRVTDARAETACVSSARTPDFKPGSLLREGRDLFAYSGERPNPITPDGKLQFSDIYAATKCGEQARPQARDGGTDKGLAGKASSLLSKDTADEEKLATVQEMAKAGITGLTFKDAAGTEHKLRLELEAAGSRQMVHLFVSGPDGKEHTALRGISRADGSFERERDRHGNFVSYEGKGYSELVSDQTNGNGGVRPDGVRPDLARPGVDRSHDRLPPRPWIGPDVAEGSMDRSQFDMQLRDPRVMAAFAGRMNSEVGNQGPAAHLAFAEEVMNRAAARNQSLMQALSGSYYPTPHPGFSHNPQYMAAITKAWQDGTDTIHGATGNASGRVGFGRRGGSYDANHHWVSPNQTAQFGGERFGHEQVDLDRGWMEKYHHLKANGSISSRARSRPSPFESPI